MRLQQGSSVVGMIREMHILHGVLSQIVQENLLSADISFLVTDIMRVREAVQAFLEESLHTYFEVQRSADEAQEHKPIPTLIIRD